MTAAPNPTASALADVPSQLHKGKLKFAPCSYGRCVNDFTSGEVFLFVFLLNIKWNRSGLLSDFSRKSMSDGTHLLLHI